MTLVEGGDTATITAIIEPSDATNKDITWTSSDETVARVTNGVVTSLAAGQTTITATAGGKTATVTVSVKEATSKDFFNFNSDTGTITGYSVEGPKDLVIPIKIDGVAVKIIGEEAFEGNELTSVIIGSSVETIGDWAFAYNQLTSVITPDSVKTIGGYAFAGNQLTSVTIGSSVETIGEWAFYRNELISLTIGSSVETIGDVAFAGNQLTSVKIGSSVEIIGESAFADNQLTSLIIPDSVTSIGIAAFNNNQLSDEQAFIYARNSDVTEDKTNLISYGGAKKSDVEIPDSVKTIGEEAFASTELTSVIIGSSVETIGEEAFAENELTTVIIPNLVEIIGKKAFYGNELTSLIIGTSVKTIGEWAFAGNELTSVIIGSSVETIGRHAFYDNKLTQVTIPESIKTIGEYAFQDNGANSNSNSIPTTDFTGTWSIENYNWVKEGATAATLETPTPIAYDGPGGTTGYSNTISLSGAEFTGNTGETMDLSNWTIDTGATNLEVSTITKTGANSVTIDYTLKVAEQGTKEGTISFTAKAAATTSNADSNQVSVTIAETGEQKDNRDIAAAKTNIEAATYTATQELVTDIASAKTKVQELVEALELAETTAVVVDGNFTAATAGAVGSVNGTDGSYTFTVTIDKGEGTQVTTAEQTMTITATKYEEPALNHEHLSFSGVTNKFAVSAEAPTGTYKIFFSDNNDADGTQVNHTTGTWSVSETVQTIVDPGQDIFYTFTEDGKDESSKVQDGTMTLALGDLSGGQELVDGETKNGFNLEYTDDMPASMFKLSGNGIETAVRGTIKIHYEDWSGMTHQDKELTEGASNSTANFDAVEIWADISSELDIQISFIDKVSGNESPLSTLIKLKTQ